MSRLPFKFKISFAVATTAVLIDSSFKLCIILLVVSTCSLNTSEDPKHDLTRLFQLHGNCEVWSLHEELNICSKI